MAFCFVLKTVYVALAVLGSTELTLYSQRATCLCHPSGGIKSVHQHLLPANVIFKEWKRTPIMGKRDTISFNRGFWGYYEIGSLAYQACFQSF